MDIVVIVLIIAALIGGVVWNHKNASDAQAGTEFSLPAVPNIVAAALTGVYCGGTKATLKRALTGITVIPVSESGFRIATRIGDEGDIDLQAGGLGTIVRARTTSLYVGSPPQTHFRSGIMGLSSAIIHALYKVLGITPNAARMKRFQRGLEGRLAKELRRQNVI